MKPGPLTIQAGASVVKEGEPGHAMYVIEAGSVEIFRGRGAREQKVSLLEAGDFFGEAALLDDRPSTASARAVTECRLLAIDAATLDLLLRKHPDVALRMLRNLAGRLRRETERADEMAEAAAARGTAGAPGKSAAPASGAASAAKAAPKTPAKAPRGRALLPAGAAPIPLPDKDDVSLGRFDSASGHAPDIELGPLDTKHLTSRRHARLVRDNGQTFVFEEMATANGTFVNGVRVVTGVKTRVADGDTLRFGGVDLVYQGD